MKITLVRPNYYSHLVTPPLGLGYLASFLKEKGYQVEIIDALNSGFSVTEIVNLCQGTDLVGINCLSAYFLEVKKLSRELKRRKFTVVIGGPHASALPELTLEETRADYVITGEGELPLWQLVESIANNCSSEDIPGVMTKKKQNNGKGRLIENLDSLPYPDWEQIDPSTYKKAPHGGLIKTFPVAPIISTRGCPFECTFCASPFLWERKIRFRSPENVVGEIEYLCKNFGVKEIHFEDDNLTLKKDHVTAICRLMINKKIKVNWATPNGVRADTLDREILMLMKRSGCYFIALGIESGSQEILNRVKKRTDLGTVERVVRLAKEVGIITQGFFVFGLPGESDQTVRETIRFAKRIPLDKAQFLILDLLPGSELWNELHRGQPMYWGYKSYQEATWVSEGLDKERLNSVPGYAFRSFFFRPRQMIFLLKYFKFRQIPFIIQRVVDFNIFPFLKPLVKKEAICRNT